MRKYELSPDDNRKSFYGKAIVRVDDNGTETLFSYGTPIISKDINGNLKRIWDGWSATTGRHIKAFCGLNKSQFINLSIKT